MLAGNGLPHRGESNGVLYISSSVCFEPVLVPRRLSKENRQQ